MKVSLNKASLIRFVTSVGSDVMYIVMYGLALGERCLFYLQDGIVRTLKMEAEYSSETFVLFFKAAQHHTSDESSNHIVRPSIFSPLFPPPAPPP